MAVRNQVRDSRGRFAGGGTDGVISRPKPSKPQPKGGSMTRALRRGQRDLYKAEQMRVQSLGGNVAGMRIIRRNIKKGANQKTAASSKQSQGSGKVSDALRGTLRQLAQSDARYFRELNNIVGQPASAARRVAGTRKPSQKRLKGA